MLVAKPVWSIIATFPRHLLQALTLTFALLVLTGCLSSDGGGSQGDDTVDENPGDEEGAEVVIAEASLPDADDKNRLQVFSESDFSFDDMSIFLDPEKDPPSIDVTLKEGPDWLEIERATGALSGAAPHSSLPDEHPFEIKVTAGNATESVSGSVVILPVMEIETVETTGESQTVDIAAAKVEISEGSFPPNESLTIDSAKDESGGNIVRIRSSIPLNESDGFSVSLKNDLENASDASLMSGMASHVSTTATSDDPDDGCESHLPHRIERGVDQRPYVNSLLPPGARRASSVTLSPSLLAVARATQEVRLQMQSSSALCAPLSASELEELYTGGASPTPVLIVHGYTPRGKKGGGSDTWGDFPGILQSTDLIPVEFRWRTNASFIDVAADLRKTVDRLHQVSAGEDVHILAHSFGGVLARTYLQGLDRGRPPGHKPKVASLTTVGTPHSGTFRFGPEVDGVSWPSGVDAASGRLTQGCLQLTCWETGSGLASGPSSDEDEIYPSDLDITGEVGLIQRGFVSFALSMPVNEFEPDTPIQVLIGLRRNRSSSDTTEFTGGDGLISYEGQRISPLFRQRIPLLGNQGTHGPLELSNHQGGKIREAVLGVESDQPDFPGRSIATREFSGYAHTSLQTARDRAFEAQVDIDNASHEVVRHLTYWFRELSDDENSDSSGTNLYIDVTRETTFARFEWEEVEEFTYKGFITTDAGCDWSETSKCEDADDVGELSSPWQLKSGWDRKQEFYVRIKAVDENGSTVKQAIMGPIELEPVQDDPKLTVNRRGDGQGRVVSAPAGIDCGSDCDASFEEGDLVELAAQAQGDSSFAGWDGACDGASETCVVEMDDDASVVALFSEAEEGGDAQTRDLLGDSDNGISGPEGFSRRWSFEIDDNVEQINIIRLSGTDNLGFALSRNQEPRVDCFTTDGGSEICTFENADYDDTERGDGWLVIQDPIPGTYNLLAYGFADFDDAHLWKEVVSGESSDDGDKSSDGDNDLTATGKLLELDKENAVPLVESVLHDTTVSFDNRTRYVYPPDVFALSREWRIWSDIGDSLLFWGGIETFDCPDAGTETYARIGGEPSDTLETGSSVRLDLDGCVYTGTGTSEGQTVEWVAKYTGSIVYTAVDADAEPSVVRYEYSDYHLQYEEKIQGGETIEDFEVKLEGNLSIQAEDTETYWDSAQTDYVPEITYSSDQLVASFLKPSGDSQSFTLENVATLELEFSPFDPNVLDHRLDALTMEHAYNNPDVTDGDHVIVVTELPLKRSGDQFGEGRLIIDGAEGSQVLADFGSDGCAPPDEYEIVVRTANGGEETLACQVQPEVKSLQAR